MNTGNARTEGESEEWWERFQDLIDDQSDFPSEYTFKFIVPSNELEDLKALFGQQAISLRPSRKGNYTSVTATLEMHSSDEIVAVYKAAAKIPGVVSL
ncbi:MAG: DUF493 domain-containing protein [Rhodothermales bacterium]|nr:DUF493 domain-containing protein [Rhodothermales bacterium]